MKRGVRILAAVGSIVLLLISWLVAATAETEEDIQLERMKQAEAYLADEIYVRAVPLLEEAAGYETEYTFEIEETLKSVYLKLKDTSGYTKKYLNLLDKQMNRTGAPVEIFEEAARYYLDRSKLQEVLSILKDGIKKTGSAELLELYEEHRYQYRMERTSYDDVTEIFNGAIQVRESDGWGLAAANGSLVIPCRYEQISTYYSGQAIVREGDTVTGIDQNGNRVALLHGTASEISNYSENRLGLKQDGHWILANQNLATGSATFEELGMYSNGAAPAKQNGKWGLIGPSGTEWVLPAEYDGIICDELGRGYMDQTVFVQKNGQVQLLVEGKNVGDIYEDARPFNGGWAAVKKNGKWGFIDKSGTVQIDYQFDDARSFSGHLAAVKQGEYWGYVSLRGEIVIEPVFLGAKSFYTGKAPVQTERGWQFISLREYEEGGGF